MNFSLKTNYLSKQFIMMFKFNARNQDYTEYNINVQVNTSNDPELPQEKYGYDTKLNNYRNKIDNINSDDWKKVRWYINVYDFQVRDPIINRAFYKYWEIINEFEIFHDYKDDEIILHCAEAPGGFIQGTNIYLQIDRTIDKPKSNVDEDGFTIISRRNKPDYRIFTISLNKDLPQYKNYNLPSYNKNILNKYICVTYGKDHTGNINNLENLQHINNLSQKYFYLITADGGFDEGIDFNHKEQLHYNLILSEIYSAINLQKQDGHFILKVFDTLTETSVHLLYLLSLCYKETYVYKPKTSRPTNSEKYIICKYFDLSENDKKEFVSSINILTKSIKTSKSKFISFTLFDEIPSEFIEQVKVVNQTFLDKQCLHLENAIELCNDKIFLDNYDENLCNSLDDRRTIFHKWEEMYNLNAYV